jgi:hypothetical protein
MVTQDFDKMTLVYTQYKNALTQTPMGFTVPSKSFLEENPEKLEEYEFDTDNEAMLSMEDLCEFQIASLLNGFILDTTTSTEAARMSAMENSTNNANELIENLTIQYQKARQANNRCGGRAGQPWMGLRRRCVRWSYVQHARTHRRRLVSYGLGCPPRDVGEGVAADGVVSRVYGHRQR